MAVADGLSQALVDLTCQNSEVCRPTNALIFTGLYFVFMVVRHAAVYWWLNVRFVRGQKPSAELRASIPTAAIDIAAILQFLLWIPLGFGAFGLSNFYLFMLPMFQEIYDVIYLNFLDKRSFPPELVKFVNQHHILSTIARILLTTLAYAFVPPSMRQFCLACILLFYCASIFLIAPSALKPFLLGHEDARVVLRLMTFTLARAFHLVFLSWALIGIYKALDLSVWIPVSALSILIYGVCEYHSVSSGLERVRADWRRVTLMISTSSL